jgi:drug/metabolite transporter (DMT)-like permease
MSPQRILGIVIAVVGVVLLVIGLQATDSLGERLSNTFTGHWSDKTNFYIIGGIVGILLGALLAMVGNPRRA